MGVIVDQWWWEKRKESITSKTGKLDVREASFDTGLMRLTLADISSSEFTFYWKRLKPYPKRDEFWKKRRDEDRAEFGWVANNLLETPVHKFLKHKYFDVRHYSI